MIGFQNIMEKSNLVFLRLNKALAQSRQTRAWY
jgi:hypothetical protein